MFWVIIALVLWIADVNQCCGAKLQQSGTYLLDDYLMWCFWSIDDVEHGLLL